ncbi:MAG: energy transducer TonB [Novosphingobium sp.]|nr:energy transducer TonB [Novosphingobium sp.]
MPPPPPPPKPATPRSDPSTWATSADYPSRALREDREGTATFRVTIDDEGRVASCVITQSSGHADLDEATCRNVTRRARFRKPSEGYGDTYTNRIRWVIPD